MRNKPMKNGKHLQFWERLHEELTIARRVYVDPSRTLECKTQKHAHINHREMPPHPPIRNFIARGETSKPMIVKVKINYSTTKIKDDLWK